MKLRLCLGFLLFRGVFLNGRLLAANFGTNEPVTLPQIPGSPLTDFVRLLGYLLLILAAVVAGAWMFKKSRFFALYQSAPSQLKILENRSIGYRNTLLVVGYKQQRFLLAVSATGVKFLSSLPDAPAEESTSAAVRPFAAHLTSVEEGKA